MHRLFLPCRNHALAGCLLVVLLFLFLSPAAAADPLRLRILHVNDFHGYAEPYRPFGEKEFMGGAAWLAGRIQELRADPSVPTLLLSAGDMIQGNPWTNMNRGRAAIELMNLMKFDAMVVGNHEFDFGPQILKERMAQANFPIIGANVIGLDGLKPYVILKAGGIRVGILGLVTDHTPYATNPENVKGLIFEPPVAAARRYIRELKQDADVLIVLSHIGFAEDRLLAEDVKEPDAVIGGHSHTRVDQPPIVGKTMVLQAWEHGKVLGVLDLTMEKGQVMHSRGHLEEIRPDRGPVDPDVAALVARYAKQAEAVTGRTIGKACRDLDGAHTRIRETSLGNMVADAMREAAQAEIALINAGSIRTSIKQGRITLKDIFSVLPFENQVLVMKLRGRQILQALEHGLSKVETGRGAFLQVSGLQMAYSAGGIAGKRVREVKINGRPLQDDQEYVVALNDYIAVGGDGYVFLQAVSGERISGKGKSVRDLVIDYIRTRPEVCPQVEGRIISIEPIDQDCYLR